MEIFKYSDPARYELWKTDHKCSINHTGSAPAMEKAGEQIIFQRSITDRKLKYTEFYGDGDRKSFTAVNKYDVPMHKRECIGHIQKRKGNRLRKLKIYVKGLGGKGKLTDSMIDRLQNYYGIAIRSNQEDLVNMKKSIFAALFHCASS